MYPLPFTKKERHKWSPDDSNEPQETLPPTDDVENQDGYAATNDETQCNVPTKPSPPTFQSDLLEDTGPTPEIASFTSSHSSDVPNSFVPSQEFDDTGHYLPSFATNPPFSMGPDASLMTQPLITTPGGLQLSALLGRERAIEYRPGYTPRPFRQGLHPGQSTVITNHTHRSNSPIPFPTSNLLTSASSAFSNGSSSFGRDFMSGFNFSGFTPVVAPPPASRGKQEQMPTPSPLYTLSSEQVAALGCMTTSRQINAKRATTPVPAFGPRVTKTADEVAKAKTKRKHARLNHRAQQMDSAVVMTMNTTSQPCKCPKNQCIKLYCECFHRGQICDPSECNCTKCLNTAAESTPNGVRTKRVKEILARKGVEAFKVKPKKTGVGCSCKKSRCLKKYCDCVQLGNFCDPLQCICKNCKNLDGTMAIPKRKAVVPKENMAPVASLPVSGAATSTRDVKVFVDVTNASIESTAV